MKSLFFKGGEKGAFGAGGSDIKSLFHQETDQGAQEILNCKINSTQLKYA